MRARPRTVSLKLSTDPSGEEKTYLLLQRRDSSDLLDFFRNDLLGTIGGIGATQRGRGEGEAVA